MLSYILLTIKQNKLFSVKGLVHPKIKMMSLFSLYPKVVPNLDDLIHLLNKKDILKNMGNPSLIDFHSIFSPYNGSKWGSV